MKAKPTLGAVVSYIEVHRAHYNREQIKVRLLQDGTDPRLIEHALDCVYTFDQSFDQAFAQANPASDITKALVLTLVLNGIVFCVCLSLIKFMMAEVLVFAAGVLFLELIACILISMVGRTAIAKGIFIALILSIVPLKLPSFF